MGKAVKGVTWILVVHREPLWANFKEAVQGDIVVAPCSKAVQGYPRLVHWALHSSTPYLI